MVLKGPKLGVPGLAAAGFALAALFPLASAVSADAFSPTFSAPTSVTTSPTGCYPLFVACKLTLSGQQTSALGGTGTFTDVLDFAGPATYDNKTNTWSVQLKSDSTLTLVGSDKTSTLAINTAGTFTIGVNGSTWTLSGPYTVGTNTGVYAGVSGSGTFSPAYNVATSSISLNAPSGLSAPSGNGGGNPLGGNGGLGATPELDSIALFGSGVLGLAGYGLLRFRARRRQLEQR